MSIETYRENQQLIGLVIETNRHQMGIIHKEATTKS